MTLKKFIVYSICAMTLVIGYAIDIPIAFAFLGVDWHGTFYPALRLLAQGQNPYAVTTFHNPIWALLPLLPLALFSERISAIIYFFINLFSFAFIAWRLRAKPLAWTAFLLSPPILYSLRMQNIDILVWWGLILPAPIALFLILLKPQMGIGIAIYFAYRAWKYGGIGDVIRIFAPVTMAFAGSFIIFGNWLSGHDEDLIHARWNTSLWPWSIPLGLALLYMGSRYGRGRLVASASPFLSPYLAAHSWSIALVGLLNHDALMIIFVIFLWIFKIIYT